ncbi:MAG: GlsB/YeaQ/YmgE family stress response membrane protein [Pseudomonadota bacterium]
MGIIAWIVFGAVAGFVAKFIMPGDDPGGVIVTILIGIAGAFVGGFLGSLIGFGDISGFDLRSMGLAIAGALVLLFGYRVIKKGS